MPRSAAAVTLARLFRERASSQGPLWRGVLADVGPDAAAELRLALATDPVASGRFRLAITG